MKHEILEAEPDFEICFIKKLDDGQSKRKLSQ
jgi:hypothetical protein